MKPISGVISKFTFEETSTRQDVINLFQKNNGNLQFKRSSVCLRGKTEEDYRLEFRIPNGGCNYRVWIDNIRLFGKMMEVSKKLADMQNNHVSSNEYENC